MRPASSTARTTAGSPASPSRSRTATSPVPRRATRRRERARRRAARDRRRSTGIAWTLGSPISALSSCGVPSATMCPWSMIPTRFGEHVGLLEVLRRQEDGDAVLVREPCDFVPERGAALDVEPGGRLVEEDDPRPVHEREREVEPALHPARVAADLAIGRLAQADAVEQLLRARLPLGAGDPLQRRLQPQMVAPGQHRVERRLLERRADHDAHLRPLLDDVVAADARRPGRRRQQRRQHQHGRRLAGAVRPEEAVDLARLDAQVDPVHRTRPFLELADETLDLDAVRSAPPPRHPTDASTFGSSGGHEPDDAERRQRDLGRERLVVPGRLLGLDAAEVADVRAAVEARVGVQRLAPRPPSGSPTR